MWPIVFFTTPDNLFLDGLLVEPENKSKTALVFIHGLMSNFYTNISLLTELCKCAESNNAAFFSFNTRGNGSITRFRKTDKRKKKGYRSITIGGSYEEFTECSYDFKGAFDFLKNQGYEKLILIGHSTGCNKLVHYLSKIHDQRIEKVILLAPLSDRAGFLAHYTRDALNVYISKALTLVEKGEGDELLPYELGLGLFTPRRFLSLVEENSPENTFPYDNPHASWFRFKKLHLPLLILFGSDDEYRDRPIKTIAQTFQKILRKNSNVVVSVIPGAGHSFSEYTEHVVNEIKNFISKTNSSS